MTTYEDKKQQFDNMMTLYGRKPVLEILSDEEVDVFRLHLADSNRGGGIIDEIQSLAKERDIDTVFHSRQALSRISKNARQDQGVAIDIQPATYQPIDKIPADARSLITLDGVTNPQNLGMIIRTLAASPCDGLVLPKKGCAKIDPLVFKASAGTLFRADIYHCANLNDGLKKLKRQGYTVLGLSGGGDSTLDDWPTETKTVFVLGNESTGLSEQTISQCDAIVSIPLNRGVESLNVASAATLVAFSR